MSLLIPRSVVRDLRTCFDSWGGIRQRAKPLRQPMPSEERWAGQISISEIFEGKLKIEDLARMRSTSVSKPLPDISPRELLWRDISFVQVSKGTRSWTLVLRGSWPHWPPTRRWNEQFSPFSWILQPMTQSKWLNFGRSKHMRPNYSGCPIVNNVWFQYFYLFIYLFFLPKWSLKGTQYTSRPKFNFLHLSL